LHVGEFWRRMHKYIQAPIPAWTLASHCWRYSERPHAITPNLE
jgi:hypothetical protein